MHVATIKKIMRIYILEDKGVTLRNISCFITHICSIAIHGCRSKNEFVKTMIAGERKVVKIVVL